MIGVYLRRRSDFKVLGSTLDALTARGLEWGWVLQADGKEDPQEADFERWGRARVGRIPSNTINVGSVLLAADAEYVPYFAGIPTITIPYHWDNRLFKSRDDWIVCYTSEKHRLFVQALWGPRLKVPSPIVGWTEFDQTLWAPPIPEIPRPYGVLYTMKLRVPEPWRNSLKGRAWYRFTCEMVKECYRQWGWTLVVKSRAKHGDPGWLRNLSPYYYLDDEMYPHTSWRLLRDAKEAVHFCSGVAWQAMALGVPHRTYRLPIPHVDHLPGMEILEVTYDGRLSPEQFRNEWIGVLDGKAGERVADVVARYA